MSDRLCLMQVHAHPDDEASKGAAVTAKYSSEGLHTVLVTCTGGEAGDILNKAVDTPEVRENLFEVRMAELRESVRILGYRSLHLLGYRDSGMPGTEPNEHPDNFANAELDEAVGRLVKIIREERPQVILTYGEDHSRYPHPDHIRVHEITLPAFDRAADPSWYPEAGEPFQPLKLYYTGGMSRARLVAFHQWYLDKGEESPYAEWLERIPSDTPERNTTRVDVGDFLEQARAALIAHRTQIDPEGGWFRVPIDISRQLYPWEHYVRARSLVDVPDSDDGFEDDLFAGIRTASTVSP
jgi:mycothiol S-conjugate amidase